ncbi:MAG: hypothetical protein PHD51_03775 [Patescibacteria group bacterium]|nr:hypothetical protein [Patescibacteria group bacterium]MDD5490910.1 hypothetical protein [Patescibacteria group bacterium]
MAKLKMGHAPEWKDCRLEDVRVRKLRLRNPEQKCEVDNEDAENPAGFLNPQWVRRDLLGMPKRWEENGSILVIPSTAFDRVAEEFRDFQINFAEIL